jgi:rod shape-determining protein MreB
MASDGRLVEMMSFQRTMYVRLSRNKIKVRLVEAGTDVEISAAAPFSTQRLLVGDFANAEAAIKKAFRQAMGTGWFVPSPDVVMHQLEMTEGGLSEVEQKILWELAIGAGARKAIVWVGPELSDSEVKEKIGGK